MSKGRSLKSCVALVVFCCSLLLACISPAWADSDYPDNSSLGFAIYAGWTVSDPSFESNPIHVPFTGTHTFMSVTFSSTQTVSMRLVSPQIQPVDFARTLVINIGFAENGSNTVGRTNRSNRDVDYYTGSSTKHTLTGGSMGGYVSKYSSAHGQSYTYRVTIPAKCTSFFTSTADDWLLTVNDPSKVFMLVSYGAFLVGSDSPAVVDLVESILAELQQIHANTSNMEGNVALAADALNSILKECYALNADTDTIITILNSVKSELVSLNGKVDNIYTLLKDSLKTESAVVDKKSQEVGEQIMQRVDSEQYWSDKNTETFNALDIGNFSFGDGVVGTLPTVSNLFKGLWDSFGDAVLMFTFPLMLGLALVIIGRISRHSGKGGKDGGDSA